MNRNRAAFAPTDRSITSPFASFVLFKGSRRRELTNVPPVLALSSICQDSADRIRTAWGFVTLVTARY